MAEQTSRRTKPPRVWIRFLPAPRSAGPRDKTDPLSDPRAKKPAPSWILELIEGEETRLGAWDVWMPGDLPLPESDRLIEIDDELVGLTGKQYLAVLREWTRLVVPDLPEEHLERLTYRQGLAIKTKANEEPGESAEEAKERLKADAANPPDGERGSDPSSRSPRDSMAGATAT